MVQYVHLSCTFLHIYVQCTVYGSICTYTCTSLHIYVQCTVYGSICTFTWHFSIHLCTMYCLRFNMYIYLAFFCTSMYSVLFTVQYVHILALLYTSMYGVLFMVQYLHLPGTSLHIYVHCTVYGSICTLTWHFSTHLCTGTVHGSICTLTWHFSTHLCTVYSIWFNMYIYLALPYTSMYSVQYMVQYVHLPDTSLHIYIHCTVHGSICTFTWHFSTHLCTSSTVAVVSVQQSAAHKCILLSNPRSLVLSISLMKS